MRTYSSHDVSWTPIIHRGGRRVGLILAAPLALRLSQTIHQHRDAIMQRVWEEVRPELEYPMPSDWLIFYKDSLLPLEIYVRHGGSDGKWLTAERTDIETLCAEDALTYSYHHTEGYDGKENRWLERVFATYMTMMQSLQPER